MKKIICGLLLIPISVWAQPEVKVWEKVVPKKGYILSLDLDNKHCKKIYTQQIPKFLEKNPHIKNPDLILIGQEITVQNCQEPQVFAPPSEYRPEESDDYSDSLLSPYVGVYVGGSYLSRHNHDTEKLGHSVGLKLGYDLNIYGETIGLAVGYMQNNSKTIRDETRGVYGVKTQWFNIEAHYDRKISEKLKSGFLVNLVMGDDISMTERQEDKNLGVYVGIESLYKIAPKVELDVNLQHRLDELSRVNVLLNLGLKFHF